MAFLYMGLMTICVLGGALLLSSKRPKMKQTAVILLLLGSLFMALGVNAEKQEAKAEEARAAKQAADDDSGEEADDWEYDSESESTDSESIAESESVAESESIATSESIAASQSAASQAEADRVAASESAAEASRQAANAYSDPRPAQTPSERHYDYAPVPNTAQSEMVYVSAAIPGRYHKDPNCRGLQRYGGAQTMTLAQAQAQGYQAFCAYERYGNN